jgi:hypothetical protein
VFPLFPTHVLCFSEYPPPQADIYGLAARCAPCPTA